MLGTTIAEFAASLRLVLLLSFDKSRDVAAAAAQITRRPARAGLDWHDLADAWAGPVDNFAELRRSPAGAAACWAEVVKYLASAPVDDFTDRDREFVDSMQAIIGRGFHPTEKPARWLRGFFRRAGGQFAEEEAA